MHCSTAAASAQHRPMVHIAMIPLEGMASIEQTLGRLYPDVLALHCMVLVAAPPEDSTSISGVHMFDFLPLTPPDHVTTARLLSGRSAQGQLRNRVLARLPRRRCWCIGPATGSLQETLETARAFNEAYDDRLRLLHNDCRTHSSQLALRLTGRAVHIGTFGVKLAQNG
eukprot:jgi/Astpho2/9049/fgenesh1_pg.00133_%23_69_t